MASDKDFRIVENLFKALSDEQVEILVDAAVVAYCKKHNKVLVDKENST
ncbi:hypothetical protein SEA_JUMBO_54 [Gordonia phage Jumbo]|uniref:Uncharacterized protein n=1 Tax=Gordonia phage Jumbo TaxID=1887650 RepID=A0A1B3B0N6_9CAUD|nr:hypothetical protein BIZ69_gp054 [Gordonia phage Jumbo]AOE44564.1 hypothetical protein SEA_JUMBO_54 [Gordonia phage Jumbo]